MIPKPITQTLNFSVVSGTTSFPALQVLGSNVMLTASLTGINSADSTMELHQSIDGITWGLIPTSSVTNPSGVSNNTWNVKGLVRGAYIRLSFIANTATAGTIVSVKLLSDA